MPDLPFFFEILGGLLLSATARGLEQLSWPQHWVIGDAQRGAEDRPFKGAALIVQIAQMES
jgi:hypothetical protein